MLSRRRARARANNRRFAAILAALILVTFSYFARSWVPERVSLGRVGASCSFVEWIGLEGRFLGDCFGTLVVVDAVAERVHAANIGGNLAGVAERGDGMLGVALRDGSDSTVVIVDRELEIRAKVAVRGQVFGIAWRERVLEIVVGGDDYPNQSIVAIGESGESTRRSLPTAESSWQLIATERRDEWIRTFVEIDHGEGITAQYLEVSEDGRSVELGVIFAEPGKRLPIGFASASSTGLLLRDHWFVTDFGGEGKPVELGARDIFCIRRMIAAQRLAFVDRCIDEVSRDGPFLAPNGEEYFISVDLRTLRRRGHKNVWLAMGAATLARLRGHAVP